MPHITVKLFPGRSEKDKERLTEAIVKSVIQHLQSEEASVSVAFEEVDSSKWAKEVYEPEIKDKWDTLYKNLATECSQRICHFKQGALHGQ